MTYPLALLGLAVSVISFRNKITVLGRHRCIGYQIHLAGAKSSVVLRGGSKAFISAKGSFSSADFGLTGVHQRERLLRDEFFRKSRREVKKSIIRVRHIKPTSYASPAIFYKKIGRGLLCILAHCKVAYCKLLTLSPFADFY